MAELLHITNLHKTFGSKQILQGVDLTVSEGESLVILGGSGTGKSVLIKIILGLIPPSQGQVFFKGQDITKASFKKRMPMLSSSGFLFQNGALFDSLSVADNITFFRRQMEKLSAKDIAEIAAQKLQSVGLKAEVMHKFPAELSGGMQKRVALARAICHEPKLIFFDEPTTGLDPIMARVINELILKVRQELKATTITITHDMASAKMIASQIAFLYRGKILWQGEQDELYSSGNEYVSQFVEGNIKGPIVI